MSGELVVGINVLYSVNDDVIQVNLRSQRADGQFPDAVIALGKVGTLAVVAYEHRPCQLHGLGVRSLDAECDGMIVMNLRREHLCIIGKYALRLGALRVILYVHS